MHVPSSSVFPGAKQRAWLQRNAVCVTSAGPIPKPFSVVVSESVYFCVKYSCRFRRHCVEHSSCFRVAVSETGAAISTAGTPTTCDTNCEQRYE